MDPNRNAKALAKVRRQPFRRRAGPSGRRPALRAGCPPAPALPPHARPCAPVLLPSNSRAAVLPPSPLAGAQEGAGPPAGAPHQPGRRVRGCELVCASWLSTCAVQAAATALMRCGACRGSLCGAKELPHGCLGCEGCLLSRPAALQWAGTCRDRCCLCSQPSSLLAMKPLDTFLIHRPNLGPRPSALGDTHPPPTPLPTHAA